MLLFRALSFSFLRRRSPSRDNARCNLQLTALLVDARISSLARPTKYVCVVSQLLDAALPNCYWHYPRVHFRVDLRARRTNKRRSAQFDRILLQYFSEQLYDQCGRCATAFSNAGLTT
jgi:hypothetical protein